jgi:preprotein translocase subunit SecF
MGFKLISDNPGVNFVDARYKAIAISIAIIVVGLISLVIKGGPQYGIDFAGGCIVQVKFDKPVDLEALRKSLTAKDLPGLSVQRFGDVMDNEYLIRISQSDVAADSIRKNVVDGLGPSFNGINYTVQRLEMVGPKVGADLRNKAIEAMFYATLLIAIYISGRFEHRWWTAALMAAALSGGSYLLGMVMPMAYLPIAALGIMLFLCWKLRLTYALGAVVALLHDVLVTIGIFSLLDKEIDLTVIAALLTIIGYSLNDTIIVYDRIRENVRHKVIEPFAVTINNSINLTLSRTLLTVGTVIIVLLSLYLFGGGVIHDFALALLIGTIMGTYSSVFIASPVLLAFGHDPAKEKLKPEPAPAS